MKYLGPKIISPPLPTNFYIHSPHHYPPFLPIYVTDYVVANVKRWVSSSIICAVAKNYNVICDLEKNIICDAGIDVDGDVEGIYVVGGGLEVKVGGQWWGDNVEVKLANVECDVGSDVYYDVGSDVD